MIKRSPGRGVLAFLLVLGGMGYAFADEGFLHAAGRRLADSAGRPVTLRGAVVQIQDTEALELLARTGANAVCLDLDYHEFVHESAASGVSGFSDLEKFLQEARRRHLWVILGLRGWPGQTDEFEDQRKFWGSEERRASVVNLWRELARRHSDNSTVAAYVVFQDPDPPSLPEYVRYVRAAVGAIREQDPKHLLVVELPGGEEIWRGILSEAPLLDDRNMAYGFREVEPVAFTRQGSLWKGHRLGVGVRWPGRRVEEIRIVGSGGSQSTMGTHRSRRIKLEAISPDGAEYVMPRLFVKGMGRSKFERVVLEEIGVFDRPKMPDRVVFEDSFDKVQQAYVPVGWGAEPKNAKFSRIRNISTGSGTLLIVGNGRLVSLQPMMDLNFSRLPPTSPNRRYRLTADVEPEDADEAGIAMEFIGTRGSSSDTTDMKKRFEGLVVAKRAAQIPLLLLDFGVTPAAIDGGGREWLKSVYQAAEDNGLCWFTRVFVDPDARSTRIRWEILKNFLEKYAKPIIEETKKEPLEPSKTSLSVREMISVVAQPPGESASVLPAPRPGPPSPGQTSLGTDQPAGRRRPNPIPPPAGGCWVGGHCPEFPGEYVSATGFSSIMRFMRRIGKMPTWVHLYHAWTDPEGRWTAFPVEEVQEISAAGATPLISWEPFISPRISIRRHSLPFILDGHADTYIQTWADAARRFHQPLLVRITVETEESARVFRRVVEIFDRRGALNVSWVWSPSTGTLTDSFPRSPDAWPGESYVDWIGLSLYGLPARPELDVGVGAVDDIEFPGETFNQSIRSLAPLGKPICLVEMGCAAVPSQAQWWASALEHIRSMAWQDIQAIVLTETPKHWRAAPVDLRFRNETAYVLGKELAYPFFHGADQP